MPKSPEGEFATKARAWPFQKVEKLKGSLTIEDPTEALVLDNGLRAISKMAHVGEAHPIDSRRKASFPATPDQPGNIK